MLLLFFCDLAGGGEDEKDDDIFFINIILGRKIHYFTSLGGWILEQEGVLVFSVHERAHNPLTGASLSSK